MKFRITYLISLILMLSACESARVEQPGRYGEISVGLSELSVDVSTKAPDTEYKVNLVNLDDPSQNKEAYLADGMSESFVVRYGSYNVYAEDCTGAEAVEGYGRRRIAGVSENLLLSDASPMQNVNIACSVVNAMAIVLFEDTVKDKFRDLKVNLRSADGRSLDIQQTGDNVNTDIVTWFNPTETFTCTVTGTYVEDGNDKPVSKSFSRPLKARDCIRMTVRLVVPSGNLLPDLGFDVDFISTETSSGQFNPYI